MTDYTKQVGKFIREVKDERAKEEVIRLFNYLQRDFASDLANARRDYQLGLAEETAELKIFVKCYHFENQLRSILGLTPLPPIDQSII